MKKGANIRAVPGLVAVVVLGAGLGFLWRKVELGAAEPAPQAAAHPVAVANPTSTTDKRSPQQLEQLRASIGAGTATPNPLPLPARPVDLRQRAEARQKLMRLHPDFAEQLELPAEDSEKFFDLLARQQQESAELIAAHQGRNPAGLQDDLRTMERANDAEQAALLGDKYPAWVQQQEAELHRNPVDELQNLLVREGMPLADDSVDKVFAAMAAEQKELSRSQPRAAEAPGANLQQDLQYALNSRQLLLKAASGYLDARQLELYGQMLEERTRTAQRLLRKMEDVDGD
jgi:hypothetical protein